MNKYELMYMETSSSHFTHDETNHKFPLNPLITKPGEAAGRPVREAVFINGVPAALKLVEGEAGKISDGYHTFDELYEHRITLFVALLKVAQGSFSLPVWRSKNHSDGSEWPGWFILGLYKDSGKQITYHLPESWWDKIEFAETLLLAPEWDGHTSADVLERLKNL